MQNCLSLYGAWILLATLPLVSIMVMLSCFAIHCFAIDACEVVISATPSRQFTNVINECDLRRIASLSSDPDIG